MISSTRLMMIFRFSHYCVFAGVTSCFAIYRRRFLIGWFPWKLSSIMRGTRRLSRKARLIQRWNLRMAWAWRKICVNHNDLLFRTLITCLLIGSCLTLLLSLLLILRRFLLFGRLRLAVDHMNITDRRWNRLSTKLRATANRRLENLLLKNLSSSCMRSEIICPEVTSH